MRLFAARLPAGGSRRYRDEVPEVCIYVRMYLIKHNLLLIPFIPRFWEMVKRDPGGWCGVE